MRLLVLSLVGLCDVALRQERARLHDEVKRLVQQSAKSTADQDREISGLRDEMAALARKLKATEDTAASLKTQLATTQAELKSSQDDGGARILSLQSQLEKEARSKAEKLTQLVRCMMW